MRIWIKDFGYYKNKGYQFFESEVCTDKEMMKIEEDFKTSTEFVDLSEINELQKELETTKKLLDEAVEIIQNTAYPEGDRAFKFLAKLSKEVRK